MESNGIVKFVLKTPIGLVKLSHTNLGIREIQLDADYNEAPGLLKKDYQNNCVEILETEGEPTDLSEESINWIKNFFSLNSKDLDIPPLDNDVLRKENFNALVFQTLIKETKAGITLSYAKLAEACGTPKAYRAVGQAMRSNPVPLVVPCHRVVPSNGGLGHYMSGRGDNIKGWLLDFEKYVNRYKTQN